MKRRRVLIARRHRKLRHLVHRLSRQPNSLATVRWLLLSTRTARRTRPEISTWNIPSELHEPCLQDNISRNQHPAVACFYSAAKHRSRGALWPIFAPAIITWLVWIQHDPDDRVQCIDFERGLYPTVETVVNDFGELNCQGFKGWKAPVPVLRRLQYVRHWHWRDFHA